MKRKVGIVLEGGAMRGMYTAGVLDTLMKENVDADILVGVSAGALFGVNFVSKQIGRAIRYNKRFNKDKHYMGLYPLLREGNIISKKYAFFDVPHRLDPFDDEMFMKSKSEFYAVMTDVKTGKGRYELIDSVFEKMEVLRASGSMPFVSKPVEYDGHKYLDGALSDNIPFKWMFDQGVEKVIVVLTQNINYVKKPMKSFMYNLYKLKYPKIADALKVRHLKYNKQINDLKKLEEKKEVFVLRPSKPVTIGKIEKEPEIMQEVYELGVKDTMAKLEDLKAYLNLL